VPSPWRARGSASLPVIVIAIAVLGGCDVSGEIGPHGPGSTGAGGSGLGRAGAPGGAGGSGQPGAIVPDPFSVPPTCTSGTTWRGDKGELMNPGRACIDCHSTDEGPDFTIAGTIYPTAHEPDLCYGADGANGALVVVTGADGRVITLTPNGSGNFSYEGAVMRPFRAKVVYMGRERVMAAAQTSGDCNICHTQSGAMSAPGRILLP
jgi:hypothetical protein